MGLERPCGAIVAECLDETAILGLTTNVGFLRALADSDEFRDATIDTAWLDSAEIEEPSRDLARVFVAWISAMLVAAQESGHPFQSDGWRAGSPSAPTIVELDSIADLQAEVFGPVLHVLRYARADLDATIRSINATGYGLTFGLHTRLDAVVERVTDRVEAGNLYVNRNMIGAVVGTQPFGGTGLSGTGPKAGGPNYLRRFATEQTVTINTAAAGGNATLLAVEK